MNRAPSALKHLVLWSGFLAAIAITAVGRAFLPQNFYADAVVLKRFVESSASFGSGSYGSSAFLFRTFGIGTSDEIAAIIAIVGCATTVLLMRRIAGRLDALNWRETIVMAAYFCLTGIFVAQISKEFWVTPIVILAIAAARNGSCTLRILMLAYASFYGAFIRSYWLVVVVLCLLIVWAFRTKLTRPRLLVIFVLILIIVPLTLTIATGQPATELRRGLLEDLSRDPTTAFPIILPGNDPLSVSVNYCISLILIAVPVPVLTSGNPLHLAYAAIAILSIWGLFGGLIKSTLHRGLPLSSAAKWTVAPALALIIVQAAFEPDFGSFLRHLSPLLPLLICSSFLARTEGSSIANSTFHRLPVRRSFDGLESPHKSTERRRR